MTLKTTKAALHRERQQPLSVFVERFLRQKQLEGLSQRTIPWYREKLRGLIQWCKDCPLSDFVPQYVADFVAQLQGQTHRYINHPERPPIDGGLSPYTIHGYCRVLKVFFTWLHTEEYTALNLAAKLKLPKLPKHHVVVLTPEQIDTIIKTVNPSTVLGARFLALFLVLYDTGIRATELCTLNLSDVKDGGLSVIGKGNKQRLVPMGVNATRILNRYIRTFRPTSIHTNVFLSLDGVPMNAQSLAQVFERITKRVGFKVHAHLLRHTFALNYLLNGSDRFSLKTILGHADISTTDLYVHMAEQHIEIQHHRASPGDKLLLPTRRNRA